MGSIIT